MLKNLGFVYFDLFPVRFFLLTGMKLYLFKPDRKENTCQDNLIQPTEQ